MEFYPIVRQFLDHFGQSHGRQGDATWRQAQSVRLSNLFDGRQHIVVVHEGLPHAHEYNVGERTTKVLHALLVDRTDLVIDFVRSQVAHALQPSGRAKGTIQAASHLRAHTGRDALFGRNQYRLYDQPVGKFDSIFDGAVLRVLGLRDGNGVYGIFRRQLGLKSGRDVAHVRNGVDTFGPNPVIHLGSTKAWFAPFRKKGLQVRFGEASQIFGGRTHSFTRCSDPNWTLFFL